MKVRWWARDIEGRGFTVDVSNSGLLIETGRPIEIGTRLHLEVGLTDDLPYFTECVVARKRTYPPQARALFKPAVGVRFVTMNEAVREITERDGEEGLGTQEQVHVPLMVDLRDFDHLEAVYERDIKHGGLMVETTELPELNSEIELPIWLPEPHAMIQCRGEVVKLFDDPPGLALRLEDLDLVRARVKEILGTR
jgi:Tfp pilus assembly protein PilZ